MSDLKTNVSNLKTNYTTYVAAAVTILGYLGQTGAGSLDELTKNFSWPAFFTWLGAFAAFIAARVMPQNRGDS